MPTGTVHFDAMSGVRDVVVALGLKDGAGADLPPERVYLRDLLNDRQTDAPCVIVAKPSEADRAEKQTVEDDVTNTVGYPVAVGIVNPENQDLALEEWPLKWRQLIADAFDHKVPDELRAAVEAGGVVLRWADWQAGKVIDGAAFEGNLLLSTGWVWVWVWKPRA